LMKRLREEHGMTLAELARLTRKTKGYLSKLEHSRKLPPFTTLSTIAQALGVDLDLFLASQAPATGDDAASLAAPRSGLPPGAAKGSPHPRFRNLDIHRHHDGIRPFLRGDSYAYLPLVTQYRGKYMSPFLMKLPPGKSRTFTHDSEEFTMLLEGRVNLIYEKRTHHLLAGDSFYLDSRIEHAFFNPGRRDALLLSVSFDYRRF
ncbi:MAG TPA: cupin domain-containing protein, partial [Planctomycetota bacterium]|nr:cupin domain-containing protein [Planctomycetota bacterium]